MPGSLPGGQCWRRSSLFTGAVVLRGHISFCTLYMLPVKVTELSALVGCIHGGGVGVVQIPDAEVAVL